MFDEDGEFIVFWLSFLLMAWVGFVAYTVINKWSALPTQIGWLLFGNTVTLCGLVGFVIWFAARANKGT